MIKSIISLTFILLISGYSFAEIPAVNNPHDSLLYDGENNISTSPISKSDDECDVRVIYVSGKPNGVIRKRTVYDACGSDTVTVYENGVLERNTVVKQGEYVKTGPNSTAKLLLPDGSVIFVNQNSEFLLSNDICNEIQAIKGALKFGNIWAKVKKLIGGRKFEVSGNRTAVGVRGTEFTLEVKEENGEKVEILKVYESSVDFELRVPDYSNIQDNAAVMEQAAKDYENGKITMDEFMNITQKFAENTSNETKEMKMKIEVNAGMMSTLRGNVLSDPVPFNTSEDRWFDIGDEK